MTDRAKTPYTSEELLDLISEIVAEWDQHKVSSRVSAHRDGVNVSSRVASILGLAEHVRHLGVSVALLHKNDMAFESSPLVRQAYECAVTVQWLGHNPLGPAAMAVEYQRKRTNLKSTLESSASLVFRQGADGMKVDVPPVSGEPHKDRARNFKRLCDDFEPSGNDLYVLYSLLSDPSHASFEAIERYVAVNEDESLAIGLRPEHGLSPELLLWITARSMIWSGMAVYYLDRQTEWRNVLRRFAKRIGTAAQLQFTQEAKFNADRTLARLRREGKESAQEGH